MRHKNIKLKTALAALGFTTLAAPISAQMLEEVIVTAQKRSESVQDVPISIQALSGDQIAKTGAVDFETLSDSLPNVDISAAPGIKRITVRGLGSGPGNPSFEQSVGLYIDGVYASRVDLFQEPFMDIERLEVLKGPQGVLFGKNSIAGALAIHSAKPTDAFEASISGNYEFEYESHEVTGVVSGPLTDTLFGRIALRQSSTGAYLDNASTGPEGTEDDATTIRGSLLWDAGDNTEVYLKVEAADFEQTGSPFQLSADFSPGSAPSLLSAGITTGITGGNALTVPIFFGTVDSGEDFISDDTTFNDADAGIDQKSESVTFQVTHNLGEHELVYLAGYASFDKDSVVDNDFSGTPTIVSYDHRDFTQISHELRIVSPKGETIEYIAGLYYLDREFDRANTLDVFGSIPAFSASGLGEYNEETESVAVFGQVTWNITDSFRASAGARYSEEDKTARNGEARFAFGTTTVLATGTPEQQARDAFLQGVFGDGNWVYERSINEDSIDPSVNVQWDFNDAAMAYISLTRATKAGGFDASEGDNNPDVFIYKPEEATGIEVGVKMELLDGRGRLNAAIFSTEFDDLQVSSFDPTAGAVGAFVTTNAGKATSQGIELEGMFAVTESLTFGANVAYLESEYDEFFTGCASNGLEAARLDCVMINGILQKDLSGFQTENAPEWSGSMFAEYFMEFDSVNAGVRLDVNHKGETSLDPSQDSNLIEDAYTKVNLNFNVDSADDTWSVGLGVFNLTDEQPRTFAGQAFALPGVYFENRVRGREVRATATYRFQ